MSTGSLAHDVKLTTPPERGDQRLPTLEDPHAPIAHAHGLIVLTLGGDRISAITRFLDTSLYTAFEPPRTLPSSWSGNWGGDTRKERR
jgi:hypothetical protein